MNEALVIVHLSSLDNTMVNNQGGEGAAALGERLAQAVSTYRGSVVIIDQDWEPVPPPRQQVYNAARDRRDVSYVHHDELEGDDWGEMIDEVVEILDETGATHVRLGGLWYNPVWDDGCVINTAELLAPYFDVMVDSMLVGSEE